MSSSKILSEFQYAFSYWFENVDEFNCEMCCSKVMFSNGKPLFSKDELDNINSENDIPRGNDFIILYHYIETELISVGLQIWESSIIMADWIINYKNRLYGSNIIELGSGVGFLSIIMSKFANNIYATDYNIDVLRLCDYNCIYNKTNVSVKFFDWNKSLNDNFNYSNEILSEKYKFSYNDRDIMHGKIDYIFASDIIYDDEITNAVMKTFYQLLLNNRRAKAVIFSQKRIICNYENESCSPHFDYFVNCLSELDNYEDENENAKFIVENIDICNLDQYFQYSRKPTNVVAYQISLKEINK